MKSDDMVNELESKWTHWNVHDTVQWFEYVLSTTYESGVINDSDCEIDDLSDNSDDDDESGNSGDNEDDEKSNQTNVNNDSSNVDYKLIERQLLSIGFRAKKNLPLIQESFQFRQYGFKNKQDRKILCKKTKQLLQKYPKQSKKKKNAKAKEFEQQQDVEGNIEDTVGR